MPPGVALFLLHASVKRLSTPVCASNLGKSCNIFVSTFLYVKICCFSLSFLIVNEESLAFGLHRGH